MLRSEFAMPILSPISVRRSRLFFTRTRAGIIVRAAVQDAEMLDGLGVNVPRVFTRELLGCWSGPLSSIGRLLRRL